MFTDIVTIRLIEERKLAGYSQRKLAELTGIDYGIIAKIEARRRNPDIETLGTLATFYNIKTDYFFGLDRK